MSIRPSIFALAVLLAFACCTSPDPRDDDAGDDDVGDDDSGDPGDDDAGDDDDDAGDDDAADDDSAGEGTGNAEPLGAMYFNPYWVMHTLSDDCGARRDAPCAYADLGLPSIKFNDIKWQYIEPDAPDGGTHDYDWSTLDEAVRHWEDAGARSVMFHLVPASPWGVHDSRPIAEGVFGMDCDTVPGDCEDLPANPTAGHWGDWEAWVTALCERYDGDGVDDIAGLQHAHLEFQLINEAQNLIFFAGTSENYLELLQHTRTALDACHPDAQLIHYGLTFNGNSHGGVSEAEFWQRVELTAASLTPEYNQLGYLHAFAMMLGDPDPSATHDVAPTVSMCAHFDAMAMHCNQSIEHMVEEHDFLRAKLDAHGCTATPILCDDSTSAPTLYSAYDLEWWDSSYGGSDMTGEQIHEALGSSYLLYGLFCDPLGLIPPSGLSYEDARAWHDRHHAAFAVKKASTALALGMTRFMAGLLEDWPPESGCYWMHQGLTASEANVLLPLDFGDPRPVYHSYGLLKDKVSGFTVASRDVTDGVTTLTFDVAGAGGATAPVHIVWYLDDDLPYPGDPEQTHAFELELGTPTALVTHLVTEAGVTSPTTEVVETAAGVYSGEATSIPVFVEPI